MSKTKEQISFNMRKVKCKDSQIELLLRKALWEKGLRYRKNVMSIYGHPDIAFISKKIVVFVDSEFWHGYDWENKKKEFKSNQEFWIPKIERNIQRDIEVNQTLRNQGWTVLRFWGKQIKDNTERCVQEIEKAVKHNEQV